MATKDISDLAVVLAYLEYREQREAEEAGGPQPEWPYDILMRRTGQCEKVCYRAMERAARRDLIEYGVSLRTGWLTDKGKDLVRAECQARGIDVPLELDAPPKRMNVNAMAARLRLALVPRRSSVAAVAKCSTTLQSR